MCRLSPARQLPLSVSGPPVVAEGDTARGSARDGNGGNYRALHTVHFITKLLPVERECQALPI